MQTRLSDIIRDAVREAPQHLATIYELVMKLRPEAARETIRARVYEQLEQGRILRVARGVYLAADGPARLLLVEADAWDVLEGLSEGALDLIVTDPPDDFGTAPHVAVGTTKAPAGERQYEIRKLDTRFFAAAYRALKHDREWRTVQGEKTPRGGAALVILTPPRTAVTRGHIESMLESARACGFTYSHEHVIAYTDRGMGYWPPQEHWLAHVLLAGPKAGVPWDLTLTSVVRTKRVHRANLVDQEEHEAEKPRDVWLRLIRAYARPGDLVADPFAGRGSWIRDAVREGFSVLAVEKLGRWVERIARDWPTATA